MVRQIVKTMLTLTTRKFSFKYVSARRIKKMEVYCYYMCIALTLQPKRFHITAIRGSENVGPDYLSRIKYNHTSVSGV